MGTENFHGHDIFGITNNLPDVPINDIVQAADGRLFIGTDIGVFGSGNAGELWEPLGEGLPSVVVTDMHIHEASNYLYIATYGRSSYKLNLEEVVLGEDNSIFKNEVLSLSFALQCAAFYFT